MRLIDAEKLKQKLIEGDGHDDDRFTEGYNFAINEIKGYIDKMPTIEAEPVGWISVRDRLPPYGERVLVVNETYEAKRLLKAAISEMPSADVQPVVRCKDCKYRKERHYEESGEEPYIKYECKFTKYSMSDEGFCSFGAKRDGDSE